MQVALFSFIQNAESQNSCSTLRLVRSKRHILIAQLGLPAHHRDCIALDEYLLNRSSYVQRVTDRYDNICGLAHVQRSQRVSESENLCRIESDGLQGFLVGKTVRHCVPSRVGQIAASPLSTAGRREGNRHAPLLQLCRQGVDRIVSFIGAGSVVNRTDSNTLQKRAIFAPIATFRELPGTNLRTCDLRLPFRPRPSLENLVQDIRYTFRTLLRAPGFSFVVILSIALAFAANATVFSVANGLLWGVLPVRDPGRMVMFSEGDSFSYPDYLDYRDQTTAIFEGGVAAHFPLIPASIGGKGDTRARLGTVRQRQLLPCARRAHDAWPFHSSRR